MLPEGALHSCLVPVGRVQLVHLLREQVRVDGVVLEGLRVVCTAEERHCKGHIENTNSLLVHRYGKKTSFGWPIKTGFLHICFNTNVKIQKRPWGCDTCAHPGTHPYASCRLWTPALLDQVGAYLIVNSGPRDGSLPLKPNNCKEDLIEYRGSTNVMRCFLYIQKMAIQAPMSLDLYEQLYLLHLVPADWRQCRGAPLPLSLGNQSTDSEAEVYQNILKITRQYDTIVNRGCCTLELGMKRLMRSRASSAACSTSARTCSSAVLSVKLQAVPSCS